MRNNPPAPEPIFWWLTFFNRNKDGNVSSVRGVIIVSAESLEAALARARQLDIHPEGKPTVVKGFQIPPEHVPAQKYHNTLLTRLQVLHMEPEENY
jgi:hypothetical protein